MMKRCIYFFLLISLPLPAVAQQKPKGIWPFRINRFDKEGRFQGRWKVRVGDEKTLVRNGRFRHGREVGTWKYYYPSGKLLMVEKHKRNLDYILVKRYHENGKLAKEGQARLVTSGNVVRYFWFGDWKVYDEHGKFSHREYYEDGNEISLNL
ncbi:hypothetical protein I2I11_19855 [Pontibacter sp. 172403-2]|uniref:toxin-antitoxin system YwqK family antitoxin n=1 Tax=Pontibacter rufus TaxID=2791028 RepID=UPI0018AF8DD2|nr:hypothetical protein [Pontibacter sp. 172403-2]MBF9255564.1 hypothetical protein [Pontibacter sp. 172403-2]